MLKTSQPRLPSAASPPTPPDPAGLPTQIWPDVPTSDGAWGNGRRCPSANENREAHGPGQGAEVGVDHAAWTALAEGLKHQPAARSSRLPLMPGATADPKPHRPNSGEKPLNSAERKSRDQR